jgi:sterol desaturase/sphingolipid hydroxylase (fatty acid hydroxylase superfamily)
MQNEILIRPACFAGVFAVIALWEHLAGRRPLSTSRKSRWTGNLGIMLINPLLVRLVFPVLAVTLAVEARQQGWGLLNNVNLPYGLGLAAGIVVLDLVIYLQHVMFHAIPLLWRLHMVHHADLDYDLTTGLRFHPLEAVLSMVIKLSAVVSLGPSPAAVVVFEVLLNGMALFNHGNIRIPARLDSLLRLFVVTPDMHRVHHSVIIRETNSNFGFNLSCWDRLFGTYHEQPAKGHDGMTIGLAQFRDPKRLTLPWLLLLPFVGDTGRQPINRH